MLTSNAIYFVRALCFVVIMMVSSFAIGVFQNGLRDGMVGMFLRTVCAYFLIGVLSLTVLYFLLPPLKLGRGVLLLAVLFSTVLICMIRFLFYKLLATKVFKEHILLVGSASELKPVLDVFLNQFDGQKHYISIMVTVKPNEKKQVVDSEILLKIKTLHHVTLVDQIDDFAAFCKENKVNEIVLATQYRRKDENQSLCYQSLLDCKFEGIAVTNSIDFNERELGKIELSQLRPSWILFSKGFKTGEIRNAIKRSFDIGMSVFLFLLVWPLMLLTAILVYLQDKGPVIYRQVRVGKQGKLFEVLKFRSMCIDAEESGAVWASKNDSRVTKVGEFIRATRLDELPQLLNIVKGEMSFVGPRPERPEFVDNLSKEIPYYSNRHSVKPGLLGWAQLKYPYGASVNDAAEKLRYDLYYIKNQSLLLDLLIMVQTVEVIVLGKGVR